MTTCPFCAEEIQAEAVVCKHCGRELDPAGVIATERSIGRSHPWYRAGIVYFISFFLLPPVFAVLALTDRRRGGALRALGAITAIGSIGIPLIVLYGLFVPTSTPAALSTSVITETSIPPTSTTSGAEPERTHDPAFYPSETPVKWIPSWAPPGAIKSYMAPEHLGETNWICGPIYELGEPECTELQANLGNCERDPYVKLLFGTGISTSNPVVRVWRDQFEVGRTYWSSLVGRSVCVYGSPRNERIYVDDGTRYYEQLIVHVRHPDSLLEAREASENSAP